MAILPALALRLGWCVHDPWHKWFLPTASCSPIHFFDFVQVFRLRELGPDFSGADLGLLGSRFLCSDSWECIAPDLVEFGPAPS